MNARNFLDQLLGMGQGMLGGQAGQTGSSGPGLGTGLLAGGALGAILGNKKLRKMGGGALAYGSAAALGALAFKLYRDRQARQPGAAPVHGAPSATGQTFEPAFDALPAPVQDAHAQAMLKALIAAAKADGHIDAAERELIGARIAALQPDADLRRWIDAEIARPLDPGDVAASATTPEMAAEIYLASVLVADAQSFMERAYLDELARRLKLPDDLKTDIETRAAAGV